MNRTINGVVTEQIEPSPYLSRRAARSMSNWPGQRRGRPGFWSMLTKRIYAYREHTGDITFWREIRP